MGILFLRQLKPTPAASPPPSSSPSPPATTTVAQTGKSLKLNTNIIKQPYIALKTRTLFPFSSKSPPSSDGSDRRSAPPTPKKLSRRQRLKAQTAKDLIAKLSALEHPPTPYEVSALTDLLTSTNNSSSSNLIPSTSSSSSSSDSTTLLPSLIEILCAPPPPPSPSRTSSHEARARLKDAWIVSSLIRYGAHEIRDYIISQPDLIKRMASVFIDTKTGYLDNAHATYIADVFKTLLFSHPRITACTLYRTELISALVRHIDVNACVDLLPRFIGSKAFPSRSNSHLLPAHKRGAVSLSCVSIMLKLVNAFENAVRDYIECQNNLNNSNNNNSNNSNSNDDINNNNNNSSNTSSDSTDSTTTPSTLTSSSQSAPPSKSSSQLPPAPESSSSDYHIVNIDDNNNRRSKAKRTKERLANTCHVMYEIASRAACLQLKHEDIDERVDGMYASVLGIVTASVFNDAKRDLDPFFNPKPITQIWSIALSTDEPPRKVIVVPALKLVTDILKAWRLGDATYRLSPSRADMRILGKALTPFWGNLVDIIKVVDTDNNDTVGVMRMGAVDVVKEIILSLDEDSVFELMCEKDKEMIHVLLNSLKTFNKHDVYTNVLCDIFLGAMKRFTNISEAVENIIQSETGLLKELKVDPVPCIRPLLEAFEAFIPKESTETDDQVKPLDEWTLLCTEAKQTKGGSMLRRRKSEAELSCISEDFAQLLYVMNGLEEITSFGQVGGAPPDDDFIGEAVSKKGSKQTHNKHHGKGLSLLHFHHK